MPQRARRYAFIGFLSGIPLSYFFQSPLLKKAMSLFGYVIRIPQILFEFLFVSRTPDEQILVGFLVGDVVGVLVTVCIICALIGGFAGYCVDHTPRR
jgi:hypothetical protein